MKESRLIVMDNCLEQLIKDWTTSIYVFFNLIPTIEYIKEQHVHMFECATTCCKGKINGHMVRRYLNMGDATSMSNLRKHAKICWGEEAVAAADNTKDVNAAHEALGKMKSVDSSIMATFE